MKKHDVQNWLDEYGKAWIDGDPEQIVKLFVDGASYRETPFDESMKGLEEIRQYWQDGAADAQEDVKFASQVWAIDDYVAIAGWQASFTRKQSGKQVMLDGVFRLELFLSASGLLCNRLEEWWHRQEICAS
ncbi:MAG: nuclear transport factor 2 family protein [Pseudomonadota bacterium]